ncbi:MAG TPA: hypothetical protein VMW41_07060 [Candidatus Bathyarchaeia archaeon]|nr:hypothetical protein [Candidatus Bathyarchaeia archaeon]
MQEQADLPANRVLRENDSHNKALRISNIASVVFAVAGLVIRALFSPATWIVLLLIYVLFSRTPIAKQINYFKLRLADLPAEEARTIADAGWSKDFYDRDKERIRKLINRDPEWAVKVWLYMIQPSVEDLRRSSLVEIDQWSNAQAGNLRAFKAVFMEEGYVWLENGTLKFKQAIADETAQQLFQDAAVLAEYGAIEDMSFPFRLQKYAQSYKDEIGQKGMLVD